MSEGPPSGVVPIPPSTYEPEGDVVTQPESALIWTVSVDYGGHEPQPGDHIAIPAKVWSEMCWLAGAASVTMKDAPIAQRAYKAVARPWPVVRFDVPRAAGGAS